MVSCVNWVKLKGNGDTNFYLLGKRKRQCSGEWRARSRTSEAFVVVAEPPLCYALTSRPADLQGFFLAFNSLFSTFQLGRVTVRCAGPGRKGQAEMMRRNQDEVCALLISKITTEAPADNSHLLWGLSAAEMTPRVGLVVIDRTLH